MKHIHTFESFLNEGQYINEGYSSADKSALTKQIVKNLQDATISGNLKNIERAELVSFDTLEIDMEFETIQLKIVNVKPK